MEATFESPIASGAETLARSRQGTIAVWRLGMIDVLLLVLAFSLVMHSRGSLLDDPGVGWHLRNIDAMWAQGGWLTTDPFSGPRANQQWLTNQWLGDLLLRFGWWWGGLEGIAAVTITTLLLMFRCLYGMLRRDGLAPLPATIWTAAGALGTAPAWLARPNIATVFFVMLTAWVLDRYHRGECRRRDTLWLLPMFIVWANTHGGFVAGLVTLAAVWAIEACLAMGLPHGDRRPAARQRLAHLSWLALAASLCTLINPYGWNLYAWVFKFLGNGFFTNLNLEWQSPDFHRADAICFEPLILLLPLLIALSRRRPSLVALGLSVLWLHFALNGYRHVAPWVLVTVPLLGRLSVEVPWLRAMAARLNPKSRHRSDNRSGPAAGWAATAAICLALLGWARWTEGFASHDPKHIPTKALRYVIDHHDGRAVFHSVAWGGWLTWHGWPELKTYIDDRNEVQGLRHIVEYIGIINACADWEEKLARHGVELVCIDVRAPLAPQLARCDDWRELYRDDFAVIFEAE